MSKIALYNEDGEVIDKEIYDLIEKEAAKIAKKFAHVRRPDLLQGFQAALTFQVVMQGLKTK